MYADRLEKRKKEDYSSLYDLNPQKYQVDSLYKVMWSITLRVFYGIPLLTAIVVLFLYKVMTI